MKRIKALKVPNGEFVDNDGNTKTKWLECGSLLEGDGKFKVKLDSVPTNKDWDGWFQCFDIEPRRGGQGGGSNKMNWED